MKNEEDEKTMDRTRMDADKKKKSEEKREKGRRGP
jgi:hypothetical protein